MNTPSDTNSGSSFDLEPDPYREISDYIAGWDCSEIMFAPQRVENADDSNLGDYFAGRQIKMDASSPEPFPASRTFPKGWDLSKTEDNQSDGEMGESQAGFSIDWMDLSINPASVKPVDLDAAK